MINGGTFKDKDQSIFEFYETLQMEYLICELRRKIYPKDKDKSYYTKTGNHKEEKIRDISERNQLPSIFNNNGTRAEISARVFNEFGLPNFMYKNKDEADELKPKDIFYYYNEGVEVKVKTDEGMKIGTISSGVDAEWKVIDGSKYKQLVINSSDVIKVKFRGESEETTILTEHVSRII